MLSKTLAVVAFAIGLSAADTTIVGPSGTIYSNPSVVTIFGPTGTVISHAGGLLSAIGPTTTVALSNGLPIPNPNTAESPTTAPTTSGSSEGGSSETTSATDSTSSSSAAPAGQTGAAVQGAMADVYMVGAVMLAGAGALL